MLIEPYRLRCLRPVRAVADLLRCPPLIEAVVVADAVLHADLCTTSPLRDELLLHAGLRVSGARDRPWRSATDGPSRPRRAGCGSRSSSPV